VAVASVRIASKYEDILPPLVEHLAYLTEHAYTNEQILDMEMEILKTLEFDICVPTSYRFLERFAQIAGVSRKIYFYARYLIELALLE